MKLLEGTFSTLEVIQKLTVGQRAILTKEFKDFGLSKIISKTPDGSIVWESGVHVALTSDVLNCKWKIMIEKKERTFEELLVHDAVLNAIHDTVLIPEDDKHVEQTVSIRALEDKLLIRLGLEDTTRFNKKACLIEMADNSGSMGAFERKVGITFFFWVDKVFNRRYANVDKHCIHHHTQAEIVHRSEFLQKGQTGGTIVSSVYKKAQEIYFKEAVGGGSYVDVFVYHISDGDNLTSDNERCVKRIESLLLDSRRIGYLEINPYNRRSTLQSITKHIKGSKFHSAVIREYTGVQLLDALEGLVGNKQLLDATRHF